MCGITGCLSFSNDERDFQPALEEAVNRIAHRGPDDQGVLNIDRLWLGHRRLSIIDLSEGGHQPMTTPDGKFALVYNGECYNYQALRSNLQREGATFKSDSDTEVMLQQLRFHGAEGLKEVNGFFAVAWYDQEHKSLHLARDRFGIKPLYYCLDDRRLIFASEINAILAFHPKLTLDRFSLNQYLHLNYVPAEGTMFREIKSVKPGHVLHVTANGDISERAFYRLEDHIRTTTNDPLSAFRRNLEDSVRQRLVADVPVGCFLSGGLDSSVITGLATQHLSKLKTFTIGFKDQSHYDESKYAALIARHFNTDHHEILISTQDLLEGIPAMLQHVDDAFADSSSIAFYTLSKASSPHIKVALSGDGGDELLGGYYKHRAFYWLLHHPVLSSAAGMLHPLLNVLPQSRSNAVMNAFRKAVRFSRVAALPREMQYYYLAGFSNENRHLLNEAYFEKETSVVHSTGLRNIKNLNDVLLEDIRLVLEGDMLVKTDRYSMAHGLEVRVPILDHHVVEAAFALPENLKSGAVKGKLAMRKAFGNMLPPEILQRPKHGFEVPLKAWLKEELVPLREALLNRDILREQGIFNAEKVGNLTRDLNRKNSAGAEHVLWNLMVFNQWYLQHREYLT